MALTVKLGSSLYEIRSVTGDVGISVAICLYLHVLSKRRFQNAASRQHQTTDLPVVKHLDIMFGENIQIDLPNVDVIRRLRRRCRRRRHNQNARRRALVSAADRRRHAISAPTHEITTA